MDISTIAVVVATVVGPIAAVQTQKWIERQTEKRRERKLVFAALMYTRATRVSTEHVQALNRIELAFYKDKKVMAAWRLYLDILHQVVTEENQGYILGRRDELFVKLLYSMSSLLRYPFTETEIKNSTYRPQIHTDIENKQLQLLNWAISLAEGRQSLPVSAVVPPEILAAQASLAAWLKAVAEGRESIPIKVTATQPAAQPSAQMVQQVSPVQAPPLLQSPLDRT
jgi:hypothetical protein